MQRKFKKKKKRKKKVRYAKDACGENKVETTDLEGEQNLKPRPSKCMVYDSNWVLSKERFETTRKFESPRHYSAGLSPPPPTMRLYAKADTRFSLTAAWSSWSSSTLTKCWKNAFSKWTVLLLPRSVGATDYLAMQINGPPPSTFPTAGFNQESQPPPVRAHGDGGPTAARSLRQAASPGRLGGRKA